MRQSCRPVTLWKFQATDRNRLALAMVGGLMWAAAVPKFNVAGLAWIAPGLILFAALGQSGAAAFRVGYVAGLIGFLGSLHWLLWIPVNKIAPLSGWFALSA